jgi:UDP-N-acetyl-D-glucosamine dehydrogenase
MACGATAQMKKVCIQGLGFAGAAMAAAVAEAREQDGSPSFAVAGIDLATREGSSRIAAINAGRFPFATVDETLETALRRGREVGNLSASSDIAEYRDCDIVVVNVGLDAAWHHSPPTCDFASLTASVRTLADNIRTGTLVLVATTVPPGATEKLIIPELRRGFEARGLSPDGVLVAHSYERVMPGRDYLKSITNYWRVYAGYTEEAANLCKDFLERVIDTRHHPLTRLNRPLESEIAKLLENTFRAVNIALIEEWARFAERAGVDLHAIIKAIRVRPTHQNLMRPGFGVGGYCLTKDPLFAGIGARTLLDMADTAFPFSEASVAINQVMPRASIALLSRELGSLNGKRILLLGATYREDVADTRHSPSADFAAWIEAEGAAIDVHDPLASAFENSSRPILRELPSADRYDAIVYAVAHGSYRGLRFGEWLQDARPLIVDANSVLSGEQIVEFQQIGCRVKSIGRGDL